MRAWIGWSIATVATAIPIVLASISLSAPTVHPTLCVANLKSQGQAMLIYSTDFNDELPRAHEWMDFLLPYTRSESIFHCPSVPRKGYGYAYNSALTGRKASKIQNPAYIPLVFDSVEKQRSAVTTTRTLPHAPRHEGRNNLAFADGSVRQLKN
jgi:prepilin-type processing-associated H-X9-DG protein